MPLCIHTCIHGGCRNKDGDINWSKVGNPLRKHAVNANKHPLCTTLCLGNAILGRKEGRYQFEQAIATGSDAMDVDTPNPLLLQTIHSTTPPSMSGSAVNLNKMSTSMEDGAEPLMGSGGIRYLK
jgi:hypothetical protein